MYIAHPTHGAGTRPHRTQLKTAARKTTLNAGQCARQPREGRGRNRQAPPPEKKKKEGGGGKGTKTAHSRQTARQHHQRRPNPPPEGTEDRTPTEAQGDHPPKTCDTKPVTAAHGEKGHSNGKKKREPPAQPERKGMEGQGPQSPGREKKRKNKSAKKKNPDNPAKKGWAQPRPGPSTHAHTARRNRKRRVASGAPTKPHTSQKQAETGPQPRTPQTADTRGTTPQTVPKHTHSDPSQDWRG